MVGSQSAVRNPPQHTTGSSGSQFGSSLGVERVVELKGVIRRVQNAGDESGQAFVAEAFAGFLIPFFIVFLRPSLSSLVYLSVAVDGPFTTAGGEESMLPGSLLSSASTAVLGDDGRLVAWRHGCGLRVEDEAFGRGRFKRSATQLQSQAEPRQSQWQRQRRAGTGSFGKTSPHAQLVLEGIHSQSPANRQSAPTGFHSFPPEGCAHSPTLFLVANPGTATPKEPP